MTRGRKKDLSIPPTRSLAQQRDYRARKANYVASLEDRCRRIEEENVQLRTELFEMKCRLADRSIIPPEAEDASKELLHNLALASSSLSKFQKLAFAGVHVETSPRKCSSNLMRQDFGSQDSSINFGSEADHSRPLSFVQNSDGQGKNCLSLSTTIPFSPVSRTSSRQELHNSSLSSDSECCGGLLDCKALGYDGFIESDNDMDRLGGTVARLSGVRSTSRYK